MGLILIRRNSRIYCQTGTLGDCRRLKSPAWVKRANFKYNFNKISRGGLKVLSKEFFKQRIKSPERSVVDKKRQGLEPAAATVSERINAP